MYKVKEIFKSIQGEGFYSGKTAVLLGFQDVIYGAEKTATKESYL